MTRHDCTPGVPPLAPTITYLVLHFGPNRDARRRQDTARLERELGINQPSDPREAVDLTAVTYGGYRRRRSHFCGHRETYEITSPEGGRWVYCSICGTHVGKPSNPFMAEAADAAPPNPGRPYMTRWWLW